MTENQVDYVRSRKEAAKILGCSVKTLTRIEARGELPRVQISRRIVGHRDSDIKKYIAARTVMAGAA